MPLFWNSKAASAASPSSEKKHVPVYNVANLDGGRYCVPVTYCWNDQTVQIETVRDIKNFLARFHDLQIRLQRLIFAGRELKNEWSVAEAQLQKHTTIHLVMMTEPEPSQEVLVVGYIRKLAGWVEARITGSSSCEARPARLDSGMQSVSATVIASYKSMNLLADYVAHNY